MEILVKYALKILRFLSLILNLKLKKYEKLIVKFNSLMILLKKYIDWFDYLTTEKSKLNFVIFSSVYYITTLLIFYHTRLNTPTNSFMRTSNINMQNC